MSIIAGIKAWLLENQIYISQEEKYCLIGDKHLIPSTISRQACYINRLIIAINNVFFQPFFFLVFPPLILLFLFLSTGPFPVQQISLNGDAQKWTVCSHWCPRMTCWLEWNCPLLHTMFRLHTLEVPPAPIPPPSPPPFFFKQRYPGRVRGVSVCFLNLLRSINPLPIYLNYYCHLPFCIDNFFSYLLTVHNTWLYEFQCRLLVILDLLSNTLSMALKGNVDLHSVSNPPSAQCFLQFLQFFSSTFTGTLAKRLVHSYNRGRKGLMHAGKCKKALLQ